ncbi:MAG: phage holin family protein [Clostridia bacterium]|nr:phage holin family protein [Clostridia bacterium]
MRKRHGSRWPIVFLTCMVSVPAVAALMGYYGPTPTLDAAKPALVAGGLLGLAHLFLRPVLRVVFAPLGCLTLGLFGMVIDVGLLYGSSLLVNGFEVPGLPYAVITALVINGVCAITTGRR